MQRRAFFHSPRMIPLDPEEILGSAIWEAVKRAFGFLGCLILGSLFALFSAIGAETLLSFTPLAGSSFLPSLSSYSLLMMPLWVMTSIFAILAVPNAFVAAFYFIRSEEPSPNRFILFTGIQQFCLTGSFNEWAFDSNFLLESIVSSVLLWSFSLGFFALIFFIKSFWRNKQRCDHEEHLMVVAAENEIWKKSLEDAEFIPPPPSGPEAPKARPLR